MVYVHMRAKFFISFLMTLALYGCASSQKPIIYSYSQHADNANVQTQLTEAAISVSNSLAELAAIEKSRQPHPMLPPPPNPASIGMAELASVNWTGPVDLLIQRLAKASHYKFRAIGHKPPIPVIVSINGTNLPLADILRDVSYQVEKQADVLIYPSRRIIELRYLNG